MREQRKVVTVVFADVVGSTSFAAHNDPEVVRSRMSRYFKRVTDSGDPCLDRGRDDGVADLTRRDV